MAININPGTPLRHVATYTSSGNFVAPANTTIAFVSIHGSTGGGSGAQGTAQGGQGGTGTVGGAFVQLNPSGTHSVTIGAGGAGGPGQNWPSSNSTGAVGGTTIFDGALQVTSSAGGLGHFSRYTNPSQAGANGVASGTTSVTALSPSGALSRVGTVSNQTTGGSAGGNGGNSPGSRYGAGNSGAAGASGIVHIYT